MIRIDSNIRDLLWIACNEYKMTYQEIADWVGVGKYVVYRWMHGLSKITSKNYDKIVEMLEKLKGRNIRYPRQAMAILRGEE